MCKGKQVHNRLVKERNNEQKKKIILGLPDGYRVKL